MFQNLNFICTICLFCRSAAHKDIEGARGKDADINGLSLEWFQSQKISVWELKVMIKLAKTLNGDVDLPQEVRHKVPTKMNDPNFSGYLIH